MSNFSKALLLFLLLGTAQSREERIEEERSGVAVNCKCAKHALIQMQRLLHTYSSKKEEKNPLHLDDVIDQISNIAHSKYNKLYHFL